MNIKQILLATAISLALVGSAHAQSQGGFKSWLKEKKDQIQHATSKDQAAPTGSIATGDPQAKTTTLPSVEVKGQQPSKPVIDQQRTQRAGGMGCAAGSIIGGMLGVDPSIGCVAGGLFGSEASQRKQIKEAREVETAARAAGMNATVQTEQQVDAKGKKQEVLSSLSIPYGAADMEAMEPKTVALLDRLANLAIKSKSTLSIRFEGKKACQIPLMELNNRKALERHQVVNECGKSNENKIVVSPLPEAR